MKSKGNQITELPLPKEVLVKVGQRIKSLRLNAGYSSYEKFAFKHDISRSQFGRYEKGEDLKLSTLIKIVQAFGISLEEFFKDVL
ncbi:MAG: helix-turn-helix transcriptional regulator [Bacteroidota bacterium]